MKAVVFHLGARSVVKAFPDEIRKAFGKALLELQRGYPLGMPLSRPMPSIGIGVEELRFRDRDGQYRVFYFKKLASGILVFHASKKKTQKTPVKEIRLAQARLKEMMYEKI